jgi:hypothetical protein
MKGASQATVARHFGTWWIDFEPIIVPSIDTKEYIYDFYGTIKLQNPINF